MDANAADGVIWPQEGSLLVVDEQPSYQVGRLIHQAESALIHAASNECGQPLVLKIYRPQPMQGESPEVQWQREQQMLGLLNHPQVLRLHAIHARGIVHLDVSPLNVLVQPPGLGEASPRFKIADFGISVLLREGVELSRPPEPWAHLSAAGTAAAWIPQPHAPLRSLWTGPHPDAGPDGLAAPDQRPSPRHRGTPGAAGAAQPAGLPAALAPRALHRHPAASPPRGALRLGPGGLARAEGSGLKAPGLQQGRGSGINHDWHADPQPMSGGRGHQLRQPPCDPRAPQGRH